MSSSTKIERHLSELHRFKSIGPLWHHSWVISQHMTLCQWVWMIMTNIIPMIQESWADVSVLPRDSFDQKSFTKQKQDCFRIHFVSFNLNEIEKKNPVDSNVRSLQTYCCASHRPISPSDDNRVLVSMQWNNVKMWLLLISCLVQDCQTSISEWSSSNFDLVLEIFALQVIFQQRWWSLPLLVSIIFLPHEDYMWPFHLRNQSIDRLSFSIRFLMSQRLLRLLHSPMPNGWFIYFFLFYALLYVLTHQQKRKERA